MTTGVTRGGLLMASIELAVFSTSKRLNLASLAHSELARVGMLIGSGQPGVAGAAAGEEQPQNSNTLICPLSAQMCVDCRSHAKNL